MFEKLMQAAERTATGVSRREFLGRLGRGAAAVAAVVGGVAAMTSEAQAGRPCVDSSDCSRSQVCVNGQCQGCPRGTCRCQRTGGCSSACCR